MKIEFKTKQFRKLKIGVKETFILFIPLGVQS